MGEPKVVNIKLDTDQNTRALNVEEIIHPREFELVINLIKKSFLKVESGSVGIRKNLNNIYRTRYHDTIVVSGSRGTGKTTFLMTLLKWIDSGELEREEEGNSKFLSEIRVLPILDPTLIELKAHPFVTIISLIYDAVAESIDCCRVHCDDKLDKKLEEWNDCFNSLAEGLPVLDGIGNGALTGSEWDDPQYVMQEGIRKARAANNLEENFNRFVEESLNLLNKGAFLICFDDIDTDFTKGWPILEILRKYLTSPKIITILSGDLELYSAIVRKSQWNNIGIDRVKGETDNQLHKFKDLVSQLENQYLLKLLRPERRISLNSIFSNLNPKRVEYKINNIEIGKYYKDNLLEKYSYKSEAEKNIIIDFVENLPIRTQIQLLLALKTDDGKKVKSIFNVFWNNWNEWNSNNSIIFDQPEVFPLVVIRFLLANDLIEDGYSLLPNNSNFSKSASLFVAGLYFQALIKTRSNFIIEFMLRIGITHEVYRVLYGNPLVDEKVILDKFVEHCKILSTEKLSDISGRYHAFNPVSTKTNRETDVFIPTGFVELYAFYKTSKEDRDKRIDKILGEAKNPLIKAIGLLPISFVRDKRGNSSTIYSIFNLLAVIGEFLKIEPRDKQKIWAFIMNSLDVKSYPRFGGRDISEDDYENDEKSEDETPDGGNESESDKEINEQFVKALRNWLIQPRPSPSPYLLSRIFTRFYDNLEVINLKPGTSAGNWMSFMICVFLNSVIIEEYSWNKSLNSNIKIRHSMLDSSNRYFLDNLKVVNDNLEHFGLSLWLMKCPLLQIFVNYTELGQSSKWGDIPSVFKPEKVWNLFDTLNSVPIKTKPINFSLTNRQHFKLLVQYCRSIGLNPNSIQALKAEDITDLIMGAFNDNVIIPPKIATKVKTQLRDSLK